MSQNNRSFLTSGLCALSVLVLAPQTRAATARTVPVVSAAVPDTGISNHPFDAAAYQQVPIDLSSNGYREDEYFVRGNANVYQYENPANPLDTKVSVLRGGPYTNRILVRRPINPGKFNGNVIVELLNATLHYDLQEYWSYSARHFMKNGDIWIGITSKPIDIAALKTFNPARYAPLSWANPDPNQTASSCSGLDTTESSYSTEDGLLWDILGQTASLIRGGGAGSPLQGYAVKAIYAAGYSQSAADLLSYINAITPTVAGAPIFDGYFLGGGYALGVPLNQCSTAPGLGDPRNVLRSSNAAIINVDSQTDYLLARVAYRRDSDLPTDRYRYFEAPGAAHVVVEQTVGTPNATDTHAAGETTLLEQNQLCTVGTLSTFPARYLYDASFSMLENWVRLGIAPPHAPLITAVGVAPVLVGVPDLNGNLLGGVRAPELDVPTSVYYGYRNLSPEACILAGAEFPFSSARNAALYKSHADYVQQISADALRIEAQGFLTQDDAAQAVWDAQSRQVP